MILQNGQTIYHGRYRIHRRLGKGGMGAVYLASDLHEGGLQVAIKQNLESSSSTQRQFQREAETLSKLQHQNLPRILNYFIDENGRQYLVMDYIDGQDLGQILNKHQAPLDERLVLSWLAQIIDALSYLHDWNDPNTGAKTPIIHRDIKPSNIKQATSGRIVLVDFGIAKMATGGGTLSGARGATTSGYSPIEQYSGGTDTRSDIYALGATLYCLLTRQVPPASTDIAAGTVSLAPIKSLNASVSRQVESAIAKAMSIQPADRYNNVAEMRQALGSRWPDVRQVMPFFPPMGHNRADAFNDGEPTTRAQHRNPTTTSVRLRQGLVILSSIAAVALLIVILAIVFSNPTLPELDSSSSVSGSVSKITEVTTTIDPTEPNAGQTPSTATLASIALQRTSVPETPAPETLEPETSAPATSTAIPTSSDQEANNPTLEAEPDLIPTFTSEPSIMATPTRRRTASPTLTPASQNPARSATNVNNTNTPMPSRATAASRSGVATAASIADGSVTLLEPLDPTIRGRVTFRWETDVQLGPGEGFEMIFWRPGEDPMTNGFSPSGASESTAVRVNLDRLAVELEALSAGRDYLWGVRLVEMSPFTPLEFLGESHQFRFEISGGGSSGSNPTPTPRG